MYISLVHAFELVTGCTLLSVSSRTTLAFILPSFFESTHTYVVTCIYIRYTANTALMEQRQKSGTTTPGHSVGLFLVAVAQIAYLRSQDLADTLMIYFTTSCIVLRSSNYTKHLNIDCSLIVMESTRCTAFARVVLQSIILGLYIVLCCTALHLYCIVVSYCRICSHTSTCPRFSRGHKRRINFGRETQSGQYYCRALEPICTRTWYLYICICIGYWEYLNKKCGALKRQGAAWT